MNMKYSVPVRISMALALLWAAVPAASWASKTSDGVTLLKQSSTFPIVISAPGSYRLKTNLTVPNANTTAILVQANNVTIDLNGFSILGPTVCSGAPVTSCTPTGTGIGIDSTTHGNGNTTVVNGTVQGMGSTGVNLYPPARVQGVTTLSNGGNGIWASTVTGCEADGNGVVGIIASIVANSSAFSNGSLGIEASTVTGCEADGNGDTGIGATVVANSTAGYNTGHGIGGASTVTGCATYNNGGNGINATVVANSTAGGNTGNGIAYAQLVSSCEADSNTGGDGIDSVTVVNSTTHHNSGQGIKGTLVTSCESDHNGNDGIDGETMIGNDAHNNPGAGLWGGAFTHSGYENNVLNSNSAANVGPGSAANMGENLCNGGTCP